MTDVHSVDAASTTVDCRIHFFWQKFGKKVDVRTSTKSGCRIHYSEKSGCGIHIFNSDVHDIHWVDAAPTPGFKDDAPQNSQSNDQRQQPMNSGNFCTPKAAHRTQVTAQPGDDEALTPPRQPPASDEEVLRVLREQIEQENLPTKTPNEGGGGPSASSPNSGNSDTNFGATRDIEPLADDTEYVVDRIVDYDPERGFLVRWFGYSPEDDNWEPSEHLPRNLVVQFFRRKRMDMPEEVRRLTYAR